MTDKEKVDFLIKFYKSHLVITFDLFELQPEIYIQYEKKAISQVEKETLKEIGVIS